MSNLLLPEAPVASAKLLRVPEEQPLCRIDRPPEIRASTRVCLAVIAGALHAAAWYFPGAWPFAWAGQIALVALGVISPPRSAFAHGMLVGAIGIGCSFYWGVAALGTTIDAPIAVAFLLYGALVTIESLAFGLFCCAVALVTRRGLAYVWLVPCAWVTIEFWFPRLFPWKLGYSQLEVIPLLQIAELVGSAGVSFVMTAAAAIPVVLAIGWRHGRGAAERWWATSYAVSASLLLAATLVFGVVREWQWTSWANQQPKLRVALIQVDPGYMGADVKLRERSLAVHQDVDLICWPEASVGIYSESLTHFRDIDRTRTLSRDSRDSLEPGKGLATHLLAGGKLYHDNAAEEGPFTMAGLLISPTQDILGKYRKRTLLPLGEYVPGQSYYPEIRHWMTIHDIIVAGNDASPLRTARDEPLGVLICYEDTIPSNARRTAAAGAEAFFSLIQGNAFENPLTLIQHQRLAVMRAVENRRYFARCASTGVTCIIGPTGRTVGKLEPKTEGTLRGEISLIRQPTLYMLIGDSFPWLCTIVTGLGLFYLRPLPQSPLASAARACSTTSRRQPASNGLTSPAERASS